MGEGIYYFEKKIEVCYLNAYRIIISEKSWCKKSLCYTETNVRGYCLNKISTKSASF